MADIQLQIKNPSKNADFQLSVPASATVGDVKARLQSVYPGAPDPSTLTVGQAAGSVIGRPRSARGG